MKQLTIKNIINIISVVIIMIMLVLYLIFQLLKTEHFPLHNLYFIIAGFIFAFFIIFREFTKKNKYITFVSYLLVLSFLVLIILIFNQLVKITPVSRILFYIGVLTFILALFGVIISLFFSHEWYKRKIRIWAHLLITISVIITIINLLSNYSWNNFEGNILIIIICVCMFNSLTEALIRSFKITILNFFERNYLISGIISLLLIFIVIK